MSISFAGLGSGLPVDQIIQQLIAIERRPIDILTARKQTVQTRQTRFSTIQNQVSSLRSSLTAFTDAKFGGSFDIFQSKTTTSSDTSLATVTANNAASPGSFSLEVINLATATKASSTSSIGAWMTGASNTSDIAAGKVTDGDFTVYINNEARTISVDTDNDTVQDVIDSIAGEIADVTGGTASGTVTADGKIQFTFDSTPTISFGATGDTSNFAKITKLTTGAENGGQTTFTSAFGISTIKVGSALVGNAVGLQNNTISAGTFTIGGAEITIDATTTLTQLINKINTNGDAGVFVSYNATTNKFEALAKNTGEQAITFDDNGTGVLASLGLVTGSDVLSSQTLGQNAQFKIDGGTTIESDSNTVDDSVSGITGVTLNLFAEDDDPITVSIANDTAKVKDALNTFVSALNSVISTINVQTQKGGALQGDTIINGFKNNLISNIVSSNSSNSTYKILAQIGISTGSPNAGSNGTAPTTYKLDATKLEAALAENPGEVKDLLIDASKGIFTNLLEDIVDPSLKAEGLFRNVNESTTTQMSNIDQQIGRLEDRVLTKQTQLQKQFAAMDSFIARLKQQQTSVGALGL